LQLWGKLKKNDIKKLRLTLNIIFRL
jgi:hypothetical protein